MVQYTFRDEIDYAKRIIERDNRDIDVSWALKLGKESEDSRTTKKQKYPLIDYAHINRYARKAVQVAEERHKHLSESTRMNYTKHYLSHLIKIEKIDFDGDDKDLELLIMNAKIELMHTEHFYPRSSKYGVKEVSSISIANKEASPTLFIDKENKKAQLAELKINWEVIEVDFKNKRSLVQMELVLFSQADIYSNTEKFGELDGQYFMYKNGWRGKCNNALCYKSIWIEHDGKVKFVEASLDMNITLGGLYIGTLKAQEFISLNYIA